MATWIIVSAAIVLLFIAGAVVVLVVVGTGRRVGNASSRGFKRLRLEPPDDD